MASTDLREDIVQLTVAAHGAAPDPALMRELEAIVDGGGTLLDAAEALTGGARWSGLYPSSQSPAEFSDAWLANLLPGAGDDLLAVGRAVVVPFLEAGGDVAGLVLAAQEFLSDPAAPAEFADLAGGFLERSGAAMEELVAAETRDDLIELAVAAHGAAPAPALMAELEAVVDGGGSLLDAAEVLTEGGRWMELYPDSQSPAEFSDAWLGRLLPGAAPALLAAGREIVVPYLEADGDVAGLVLLAQEFLSAIVAPVDFAGLAEDFRDRGEEAAAELAAAEARIETREDLIQLVAAAHGAAPDPALMAELEAIADGGGTLLEAAEALTGGERWAELYPAAQSPAEFADAWLMVLLPGLDAAALAARRDMVVARLEAGDGQAAVLLEMQELLSGDEVPAGYEDAARNFVERGEEAAAELDRAETRQDIVQLVVAAYDAAPGAVLMDELDAIVDGGGTLLEAAEVLVEGERWDALYPAAQTAEEFVDAWLARLLPGLGASTLAARRAAALARLEAGDGFAAALLEMQEFLSGDETPAAYADAVGAFLNKAEVAQEHSVAQELDGDAAALRDVLDAVTEDPSTARAAIDALGEPMTGGQTPAPGGGGQTPAPGGGGQTPGGGGQTPGGGGQTPGSGGGGQTPGSGGGGGQTPAPSSRDAIREDLVQLTVAAYDAAPDAALMRELEAIVDRGGSLLDAAEFLVSIAYWMELYPDSQSPEEFADAWLMVLLPGLDAAALAARRDMVVARLEAGGGPAAVLLEMQEVLSADEVPAGYETTARYFLGRSETAAAALAASERVEDLVQLTVAAYDAAPGAALMAELLEAAGGGGLSAAAEVLVENERWEALYPSSMTPAEFSDAWGGTLFPGAGANLLADWRTVVVPHIEGAGAPAELVLLAQGILSNPVPVASNFPPSFAGFADSADFADFVEAFLNRGEVAAEHSVFRMLDGTAAALREVLASVTEDPSTVQAAIDALDDPMPGGQMPAPGGGGQTPAPGGGTSAALQSRDSTDDMGRIVLTESDEDGDGTYDKFTTYTRYADGGTKTETTEYDDGSGGGTADDGIIDRTALATYDEAGRLVISKSDYDSDGTWDRISTYTRYADGGTKTQTTEYDDGSGGGTADDGIIDRTALATYDRDEAGRLVVSKSDYDSDGTWDRISTYTRYADGGTKTQTTEYDDGDYGNGIADDGTVDNRWVYAYDEDGRRTSWGIDEDADGTYDRVATYTYHENGGTKTRLWEYDDGSGGGTADDGTTDWIKLETFDADGMILSTKIDNDADGIWDVTGGGGGQTPGGGGQTPGGGGQTPGGGGQTPGSGGQTPGGGGQTPGGGGQTPGGGGQTPGGGGQTPGGGGQTPGGGGQDPVPSSRDATDDQGRVVLSEFDDDKDGTYDRAEAYEYGAGNLKTKTTWYDDWALEADGTGKDLAEQIIDRALTVDDANGDGTGESNQHDKYDAAGKLVVESRFDDEHDGTVDRAEAYDYDAGGALVATKYDDDGDGTWDRRVTKDDQGRARTEVDKDGDGIWDRRDTKDGQGLVALSEFDGDADGRYERAEAYAWDAAGAAKIRTDFYDGWDDTMGEAAQQADRALHVKQDYDSDGTDDDSKTETFDDAGRAVKVVFDHDTDQSDDRIEIYTYSASDTADRRWLSKAEDHDADGNNDIKTTVTYSGSGADLATQEKAYDDGSGGAVADDGTFDKRIHETFDAGGAVTATKYDDDGDGTWERRESKDAQGRSRTEVDGDGDGVWDRRDTKDGGLVALSEFDDDKDGSYERAEAYVYGDGAAKIRTDFYDDWDDSRGTADLATLDIDRSAHFMRDYDGDGAKDDGKTETFDGEGRAVRIEYDHDADETVDRIEKYTYEGAGEGWKTLLANDDATVDDMFERRLTAVRDAEGRIGELDASASTAGLDLNDVLAGNTGMLKVTATAFDDTASNAKGTEGGSRGEGTIGTGQTFDLGDGMDAFTIRSTATTEDEFDGFGLQTKSAPRLTIDAGGGGDMIIAPVDVTGAVVVDGGKGDDAFKFIGGEFVNSPTAAAGHFLRFDGGAGDDTLLVETDAAGSSLQPLARIANVENIHLALDDTGANGSLTMRLLVADGFDDAVKVTSKSAATLTAEDLAVTFALEPGADGGAVNVGKIDVTGIAVANRPRINVEGGPGDDTLTGGAGPTVFGFDEDRGAAGGDDTVKSYSAAEGDIVEISGGGVRDDSTAVMADGIDTVIAYTVVDGMGAETEHKITVVGVSAGVVVMSETASGLALIAYTT